MTISVWRRISYCYRQMAESPAASRIAGALPGTAQSYLWTVPAIFAIRALICVVAIDAAGNQGMDNSDGTFIIQVEDPASRLQ